MAATSLKKINRAALAERRVHKKLVIITLVFYGVAALLFLTGGQIWDYRGSSGDAWYMCSGMGVFFAVLGAFTGFITAFNVFREMNNQQLCDVSMSLPIKSRDRFLSKLLTILYIQILPLIVLVGGSLVANCIISMVGKGVGFESLYIGQAFAILFQFMAAEMFAVSIAILCTCCCGAFAESIYFSLILMFIINVLPQMLTSHIFEDCAGLDVNLWNIKLFSYWGFWFFRGLDSYNDDPSVLIISCAVGIVVSLAVIAISGMVYKKRDARSVGNPISNKVFFELIMFLGVITIYTGFIFTSQFLWGVLIAAVIYTIISIIVSRAKINLMSFAKWAVKFVATSAAFMIFIFAAVKTGGFGAVNISPDADELEGCTVEFSLPRYNDYDEESGKYIRLKSKELTHQQAQEVIGIYRKATKKAMREIPFYKAVFSNPSYYYNEDDDDRTLVALNVSGADVYEDEMPKDPIAYEYDSSHNDNGEKVYNLRFYQSFNIEKDDALELAKELEKLDYVYDANELEKLEALELENYLIDEGDHYEVNDRFYEDLEKNEAYYDDLDDDED